MWILDCYSKSNSVEIWVKDGKGQIVKHTVKYPHHFYLHLPDDALYSDMIEALEAKYRVEKCEFKTIYGPLKGYRIYAGRRVAERVEKQTRLSAKLYNVDVRLEQRFMGENGIFPCGHVAEMNGNRFKPDFDVPLKVITMEVKGDKPFAEKIVEVKVNGEIIKGPEKQLLSELFSLIGEIDPDVILFPDADYWMELIVNKSKEYGLKNTISRTGRFRKLTGKSYWSYGKANYRHSAYLPEGRVLIDTENSFNYNEAGLDGILLASRLTGLSPNLTARFTPGTLISSYEVYEALMRNIAVPFRKSDAEDAKTLDMLKAVDRGGMIFQPEAGVYENVYQLDFTSMYPSIIVKYNLSPETVGNGDRRGFLAEVLEPLLNLRLETKKLKKKDGKYGGLDSILKWMLVTCFGYTGYRNAKFGRIEVHESINSIGREILLKTKEIAESLNFEIIHGIVDCLWLKGGGIDELKRRVEDETGLHTDVDFYDWVTFLPMKDGFGSYNCYYGRLGDGKIKLRGVAARRRDTPEYIRRMQLEMFNVLSKARNIEEIGKLKQSLIKLYEKYRKNLRRANPEELVIRKRISKTQYRRRCAEASALKAYKKHNINIKPGMEIEYVVVDSKKWIVDVISYENFDFEYYSKLLDKAWSEISFVFKNSQKNDLEESERLRKINIGLKLNYDKYDN